MICQVNRKLLRWLLLDKPESLGMTFARENEIYTGKLRSENEEMHARTL